MVYYKEKVHSNRTKFILNMLPIPTLLLLILKYSEYRSVLQQTKAGYLRGNR
jgi:hypothetical protein